MNKSARGSINLLNRDEYGNVHHSEKFMEHFSKNLIDNPTDGIINIVAHGPQDGGGMYDMRGGGKELIATKNKIENFLLRESAEYRYCIDNGKAVSVYLFVCYGAETCPNGVNLAANFSRVKGVSNVYASSGLVSMNGEHRDGNSLAASSKISKLGGSSEQFTRFSGGKNQGLAATKYHIGYSN